MNLLFTVVNNERYCVLYIYIGLYYVYIIYIYIVYT